MPPPKVTLLYTRADALRLDDWQPQLPPAYSDRLNRMRSTRARNRTLAGLWLLQQGAPIAGFRAPELSTLGRDKHGRPLLADGPAFNISHSDNLIACAIGHQLSPGLDVEHIRPIDPARFRRVFTAAEIAAATHDQQHFFRLWTAREASVKATGRVGLTRMAGTQITGDQALIDNETLHLQWPDLCGEYVTCLATPQPALVRIQQLPIR